MARRVALFLAAMFLVLAGLFRFGQRPAPASAPDAAATGPRALVVDMAGHTVAVPGEARRPACLDVLGYQKLFMLGVGDKAALIYFTDAPWMRITNPGYDRIPTTEGEPNLEELILRKVDVAFFAYNIKRMAKKLDDLGIPGLVSQPRAVRGQTRAAFLAQTKRAVLLFGQVMGARASARAREWCAYLDDRVRYVTARTDALPAARRPRVYYLRGPTALHTSLGRNGCIYWFGEMAGADMVIKNEDGEARGPVSMESIIAWDPEVVLVGRQYPLDMVLGDSRWRNVSAVRHGRVYPLPSGVFYWDGGLECVLLMEYMAKTLHPELFADLDLTAEFKEFFARFYHYRLTDDQAAKLLAGLAPDGTRRKLYNN